MEEDKQQWLDFTKSIAGGWLRQEERWWEAIPQIADQLLALSQYLPADYQEIKPQVWVGPGSIIAPTATILGPAIIGANCQIRHGAFVRSQVICGDGVVIGNATEVKNSILFDAVQIPHFNYVGDSILGYKAHLGAGAIISNFKSAGDEIHVVVNQQKIGSGLQKLGALLGDRVEIGCNAVLFPGTIIGNDSIVYPLTSVRGTIPAEVIIKNDGKQYPRI
jgi:NDP-sugar pyrophosphorylase family protein